MTLITQKPKEEIKMIGIEQYRKIQEYKELGLTQTSQQILEYERRRLCKGS
jgi:hypothetical protein